MARPITLQQIKLHLDSLPSFPVDRANLFYGNTDRQVRPLVIFSDLDVLYPQTTCGAGPGEGTFNVHVLTDPQSGSLAQAETLSAQINDLLDGQYLSGNGANLVAQLVRYQVITEPTYVFHVCRTYSLLEG